MTTDPRQVSEPTKQDLLRAAEVVADHLSPTPLIASPLLGDRVLLKLETFQPTGSFKVRGGLSAVANMLATDAVGRVVTASAGNHGLGVAYAARALGVPATIVLPENATTGYSWKLNDQGGSPLQLLESTFEPATGGGVGSGGLRRYRFSAVAPGTAEPQFRYARHFAGSSSAPPTRCNTASTRSALK